MILPVYERLTSIRFVGVASSRRLCRTSAARRKETVGNRAAGDHIGAHPTGAPSAELATAGRASDLRPRTAGGRDQPRHDDGFVPARGSAAGRKDDGGGGEVDREGLEAGSGKAAGASCQ